MNADDYAGKGKCCRSDEGLGASQERTEGWIGIHSGFEMGPLCHTEFSCSFRENDRNVILKGWACLEKVDTKLGGFDVV